MANKKDSAALQHEKIGIKKTNNAGFRRNDDPRAAWFCGAGLGLFIHFGLSAVNAEVDLSWGMIKNKPWDDYEITPNEYFRLAKEFCPDRFDPDKWLKAAANAGFKYAVFTTRHHDGFALWGSKYGSFNVMSSPCGRDLVREYVDACRKNGLKVGLYYSPPDWYYNRDYMSYDYASMSMDCTFDGSVAEILDADHRPAPAKTKPEGFDAQYLRYIRGQITELMTNYGEIDILWFDGGSNLSDAISISEIREMQPGILVNTRMHSMGDFETFECRLPDTKPEGWWEHEDIWAQGPWWGYMKQSKDYKTIDWFISEYEKTRAMGGNFLVNVGPMADGSLPDVVYERLREVEKYFKTK